LLELAGAQSVGVGGSIDPRLYPIYYRVVDAAEPWTDLAGRLLSFRGEYVVARPNRDARVVAQIEDMDYSRMHKNHMVKGAYPGAPIGPMILSRCAGAGRAVYVAGSLDTSGRQVGDLEALDVLARATRWAAGTDPPVWVDCPPSVEIVTHAGPDGMVVFLINRTMNQVAPSSVIRFVVPVTGVEIRLRVPRRPRMVSTVTGREPHWGYGNGCLTVRLERLDEYEVVLVDP
jgi:hypothetical protein